MKILFYLICFISINSSEFAFKQSSLSLESIYSTVNELKPTERKALAKRTALELLELKKKRLNGNTEEEVLLDLLNNWMKESVIGIECLIREGYDYNKDELNTIINFNKNHSSLDNFLNQIFYIIDFQISAGGTPKLQIEEARPSLEPGELKQLACMYKNYINKNYKLPFEFKCSYLGLFENNKLNILVSCFFNKEIRFYYEAYCLNAIISLYTNKSIDSNVRLLFDGITFLKFIRADNGKIFFVDYNFLHLNL